MIKRLPLVAALILAGCAAGPNYQRPAMDLPTAWSTPAAGESSVAVRWWQDFHDAKLSALIDETLAQNADLRLAAARVDEAQAQLQLARSEYSPSVDAELNAAQHRSSLATANQMSGMKRSSTTYRGGLSASYEVDVWGRVRRSNEAALAALAADTATRDAVQASLAAQVAQAYFEGLALERRIALLERTLKTRLENVRLQQLRLTAGSISPLDVYQAESEAEAVAAILPGLRAARSRVHTALAVLQGRSPRTMVTDWQQPPVATTEAPTLPAVPSVPTGLPSALLERRPDLRAAEARLRAANARIGEAKAAYFPRIGLTAFAGGASASLGDLFSASASTWDAAAALVQPLAGLKANRARVKAAEARSQAAEAEYVQTVRTAFKETLDALTTLDSTRSTLAAQERRVTALKESYRVADLRYRAGSSGYLELLDVERNLLQVEQEQVQAQLAQLNATVDLYRALGGGWEPPAGERN